MRVKENVFRGTGPSQLRKGHSRLRNPALKRAGILGLGIIGNQASVIAFDYAIYPFVIWTLGLLLGGAVMIVLSFVVCYVLIRFYDWTKQDWLGIEAIKGLKECKPRRRFAQFVSHILRRSDALALVLLSIRFDPFITVLYLRHGNNKFNGLSRRDWSVFLGSLLIANVYWSVAMYLGTSGVEWLYSEVVKVF